MMKFVIILIVLLLVSFQAYSQPIQRGEKSSLTLVPLL
ncbi:TPA: type I toxin-antitoxin system Ibs family toxin [Escherichia coli]|nr:type I toxin-antitoxin system Ibs family toxin [Escherichia coli]HCO6022198.1 type I toxin-antitoxin system Ibs family toxin [Escherichia coli]